MPAGHRAVIFDMDGVLIDSRDAHYESWRVTGLKRDIAISYDLFMKGFGRTNLEIIPMYGGGHLSLQEMIDWGEEKEDVFGVELRKNFPEMRGISDLIKDFHESGWLMAIASSGYRRNVTITRECLCEGWRIPSMTTYEDIAKGKPDPEVFLRAAAACGVAPNRCVVVEDSMAGVQAGKAANMKVLAITGTTPKETLKAIADKVIDSYSEVTAASLAQNFGLR